MRRETSLYLDLLRFVAALAVCLGHISGQRLMGGLLWQFGPYGPEAVTVFFVLSGYVISFVVTSREGSLHDYAVARLARIYSVAFPALLLTFALDAIGRSVNAGAYVPDWGYSSDGRIGQFFAGLFFVHRLWMWEIPQGSNLPYWSLGFEIWYYIIFGCFFFLTGTRRWVVTSAMCAIAGPQILAMFPLWLLGVGAHRLTQRNLLGPAGSGGLATISLALWIGYEVAAWRWGRPEIGGFRPELIQDYVIGVLFSINLVGVAGCTGLVRPLMSIERPIRWLAGMTFTLYLFHLPVAQFITAVTPGSPAGWPHRIAVMSGTAMAVVVIAAFTERRKTIWRRVFSRLLATVTGYRAKSVPIRDAMRT
jgi:peptidoglycan/LPS O-acetylase OafA/YrhL